MKDLDLLDIPEIFLRTPGQKINEICNGAGPKNWGWIIPDTMYGLSITAAANIHDVEYHFGKDIEDKDIADRRFMNNMLRLIQANTRWNWLKKLRFLRAKKYYAAVHIFGGPAFWAGKNK